MNPTIAAYLVYLPVSVAMTVWVARTLHRNGRVFLVQAFRGREDMADAVNHLLVVGFYLINLGFITAALRYGAKPTNPQEVIEFLSTKLGIVMLVLGGMHFFNMRNFDHMRRKGLRPEGSEVAVPPPPMKRRHRILLELAGPSVLGGMLPPAPAGWTPSVAGSQPGRCWPAGTCSSPYPRSDCKASCSPPCWSGASPAVWIRAAHGPSRGPPGSDSPRALSSPSATAWTGTRRGTCSTGWA